MARTRAAEIAREVTERELLGAALEIIVKKGYYATTISDIVRAAGVTQGTFYLYFKNKADIFSALLHQYRELTISGLFNVDLKSVTTQDDWLLLADRIAGFLLDHLKTHGDFLHLFVAEAATIGSGFRKESDTFSKGVTHEIARLLHHGVRMKLVKEIDVEAVAVSILGALKEAIHQSFFGNGSRAPDDIIPRVIRSLAHLLLE